MSALLKTPVSVDDYFDLEESSDVRHEYINGEILAMAGGSLKHNRIAGNVLRALGEKLETQGCEIYINDVRVKLSETGGYVYPDVVIVCGDEQTDDYRGEHLLNPAILIEVLSDSTQGYDRGLKWAQYKQMTSLQEYILVEQERPYVEQYTRQTDGSWRYVTYEGVDDTITFPSVGAELALAHLYRKVAFA